ncbi:MAG TPA: hypothetical protein VF789_01245 [Thermoanaerobaculia bacterium]
MKKQAKKLKLAKETLRGLSALEWGEVAGGGYTDTGTHNTVTCPFTCRCELYKPPTT